MRWIEGAIGLLIVAAIFVVMARTWRGRARRDAALVQAAPVPDDAGAIVAAWDGFAVATTHADRPLDRIYAAGLTFRGRAALEARVDGLVMRVAGADDRWIDRSSVRGADRATWAIDRTVEPGGLVRLRWTATGAAGATDLDTYFRFPEGDAGVLATITGLHTTNSTRDAGEGNTAR